MTTPHFETAQLSKYATAQSIERGRAYFQNGAVGHLVRRGDELEADVEGTGTWPYRVWIEFKVKQAYLALDQRQEWQTYLGTLREKHRSRRKLMPMLAGL
jgi:uncharacterized Zn finger protein